MDKQELINVLNENTVDSTEAREMLGVGRPALSRLRERGRPLPIKGNLYWKEDVESYQGNRKRPHKP